MAFFLSLFYDFGYCSLAISGGGGYNVDARGKGGNADGDFFCIGGGV